MTGETIEIGKTEKIREKIEETKKEKENLATIQSSPVLLHHPHLENNTSEFIVTPPPARTAPLTTLIS